MKRPNRWFHALLALCFLVIAGEYVALTWLGPYYMMRWAQEIVGGRLTIGGIRLSFPLRTALINLRLAKSTPETSVSVQRAVILPRWFFVTSRHLLLERLEIERPLVRVTRTASGDFLWPRTLEALEPQGTTPSGRWLSRLGASAWPGLWKTSIHSIQVTDGAIELVDQMPDPPFHGLLDHVAIVMGPVILPHGNSQISFAARAMLVGHEGATAPCYCSGWVDLQREDLEASCQLEAIVLAAFEPYYHGVAEIRVYTTKLSFTSQWSVKSNQLNGRIQWQLTHLSEGDLSVHGRTLLNLKRVLPLKDPSFRGEIALSGLADEPQNWYAELIPGDPIMQQLAQRLLNRGVERVTIPWWGHHFRLSLIPASQTTMQHIETTSKEIQEALEILALPLSEETSVPETPSEEAVSVAPPSTTASGALESVIVTPASSPSLPLTDEVPASVSPQSLPETTP